MVVTRTTRAFEDLTVYGSSGERLDTLNFDLTPVFNKSSSDFIFDVSEARIVGVYAPEGLSRITLLRANRVDHLQCGYAISEPATTTFALGGLALFMARRRKQ